LANWIPPLAKTRQVIAVETQGHGRTADIDRDFNYEDLADDIAGRRHRKSLVKSQSGRDNT
jgi:hypothetical protein